MPEKGDLFQILNFFKESNILSVFLITFKTICAKWMKNE